MIRAVAGIVYEDVRILVAERPPQKSYAGYWEFPGGKIEPDETSFEALQRELREELAIEVLSAELWLQNTHNYPDKTVVLDIWKVTQFTGQPRGMEGQKLAWIMPEELVTLKILEGNKNIIKKLLHSS